MTGLSHAELQEIVSRKSYGTWPNEGAAIRAMQIMVTQAESDAKLAAKTALALHDALREADTEKSRLIVLGDQREREIHRLAKALRKIVLEWHEGTGSAVQMCRWAERALAKMGKK